MKALLAILIFILPVVSYGLSASFQRDGSLLIQDGKKRILLRDISEAINCVPTAPCVHAVQKRNGEYYVVVTTSRWTRGFPPRDGAGGCGEEAYFSWLHIADDKLAESTAYTFRSWSDNREGGINGWSGSVLSLTTDDLIEEKLRANEKAVWQTITFSFDSLKPEAGIQEVKGKADGQE